MDAVYLRKTSRCKHTHTHIYTRIDNDNFSGGRKDDEKVMKMFFLEYYMPQANQMEENKEDMTQIQKASVMLVLEELRTDGIVHVELLG